MFSTSSRGFHDVFSLDNGLEGGASWRETKSWEKTLALEKKGGKRKSERGLVGQGRTITGKRKVAITHLALEPVKGKNGTLKSPWFCHKTLKNT